MQTYTPYSHNTDNFRPRSTWGPSIPYIDIINKAYMKMFYLQNIKLESYGLSAKNIYRIFDKLTEQLAPYDSDDNYPAIHITNNSLVMNDMEVAPGKVFQLTYNQDLRPMQIYVKSNKQIYPASADNFMKFTNLLLWAFSTKRPGNSSWEFAQFASAYNYTMALEFHNARTPKIAHELNKYASKAPFEWYSYYDRTDNYSQFNHALSKMARHLLRNQRFNLTEASLLQNIVDAKSLDLRDNSHNHNYYLDIYVSPESHSIIHAIMQNAQKISIHGPHGTAQTVALAHYGLITGERLVYRVRDAIKYSRINSFKAIHNAAQLIAQVKYPNRMYPSNIDYIMGLHKGQFHSASANDIRSAISKHKTVKAQYTKAIEAQRKADERVAKLRNQL